jgi:hypothetical protein
MPKKSRMDLVAGGPPAVPSSLKDRLKEASFRSAEDAWSSSSNKGRPSAFLRLYSEAVSGASFVVLSDRQELLLSPPSNNQNCHIFYQLRIRKSYLNAWLATEHRVSSRSRVERMPNQATFTSCGDILSMCAPPIAITIAWISTL